MTDHPPNPHRTDQGDSSPAPASPQHDKEPTEVAPETAEKDNKEEEQADTGDVTNGKEEVAEEELDEEGEAEEGETKGEEASAPPLPDEVPPPLPSEAPPGDDDGWEPVWDPNAQAYYFYNRFTGASQWENPRVPEAALASAPDTTGDQEQEQEQGQPKPPVAGGYNPAIHGDYDPTAPYAQQYEQERNPEASPAAGGVPGMAPGYSYEATGAFNRFTGRWQADSLRPENYSDENKSHRQMNAFFDVDAAANTHDGRSLRAERSAKKLSKKELKAFKDKRREKKEEKRRAWLRD
ncbi:WW domain-containing protein [Aspergillus ruber CBS 135680]|uniref:WW domain-containing protein n=1 Tax=Aspergillus ruber (strain CBS 135680) TaxID=1388766 RepID=A0A017SNV9_ASPRC|nr:uncharacterized protein EURHEDRAFT_408823 [Aspergillus ruber CBS 135680]EYE98486.1 hypothetical protein EURHEDRAFT_408823 [Aspergillus ruber CBS 135680]